MSTYSVADAKDNLPRLIDRALEGEEVVITRHGRPVAELRPATARVSRDRAAMLVWLRKRREARPGMTMTSVQLLNELHDE
jgi:prevent-host-death family protein